ncbi:DUF4253 domain-containing protein [Aquihabitans sp. G128]|uniref:DUF4253 domain-containing protein n=1 Tax=Aquihabitans sp. G128 TaxID=2849779 RepID=UPI001C241022|nr:DUF4253 domain-containing protein [Aquihabitans sp. G128]QXC61508.1 DUF4253 domain-containing protein [Aquihabitans sp. G128]
MSDPSRLPGGAGLPPGIEPWCRTLRGEQAWRMDVAGGETALATWEALRQRHARTGLWPVLLGADRAVVDQLTWRVGILAEQRPGIPLLDHVPPAPELFVEWMGDPATDDYLNDVPRHLAKLEVDQDAIRERLSARPDAEAVRAVAGDDVVIALVPAAAGWEVPALLAWSGAERDDIGGPEHLSVLHYWHEVYGADLVALGMDQLECLVTRPPADARGAFELAVQHYAYCPALMDNLVPAMGALAATLFGRHWFFDWS